MGPTKPPGSLDLLSVSLALLGSCQRDRMSLS
ncbi:unnamed protein product [Spirodela intermedia]|uniref:Uncharacterized protein n=1 Tax=Spirodela intermedia TaxID=51605 RepID=A0A7I8JBA3_SPIIN|nr:unnamed protein product [Spirodela intermedia]CAA6667486.1 unnamed protein product [Spirodela intermedia]